MHFHHPVAITHPETGRAALYVNRLMSQRIDGLVESESDELLETLFRYAENPDFIYEHRWRPGDLVFWDNRYSTHARTVFRPTSAVSCAAARCSANAPLNRKYEHG